VYCLLLAKVAILAGLTKPRFLRLSHGVENAAHLYDVPHFLCNSVRLFSVFISKKPFSYSQRAIVTVE
jgi:hypothetical protein